MQSGQGQVSSLAHPEIVESHLEKTALNSDQRRAVLAAATTTDQFIAWQGVAGAGKTFALKELKEIAAASGYTIKGFAPSSMAAKVLSQELDIQAETVARLLVSELPEETEPHQIWVVDEAGLLSAKDALTLLERATVEQARVLLVGDTKQLSAVEAGNPFKSLQQAGIKTSYLNESNRQRAPKLKLAVDLIASGRIEEGFSRLDENGCIETVTPESKIAAIANDYITATPEERVRTLVLAGTNFERLAITQKIREHLKTEGSLATATTITQLQAKDLTSVQMRYTHNFELGDLVMPTRSSKRRGLEKGHLYEVVGKDNDQLTLKASDGQYLQVDTGFNKAVYRHQHIEIAEGDRLRWTKNDRQLGRRNGQEFVVKAIVGCNAQIEYLDSGQTEFIDLQQAQHLDYAIVSTTYSSQGKTADRVLMAADLTIGQESFYVAVSRARYSLKLYTEDKDNLLALAQSSKAQENALVLLRQKELEKQHQSRLEKEKVTSVAIVTEQPTSKQQERRSGSLKAFPQGGTEEQSYTASPLPSSFSLHPNPSAPLPSSSPVLKTQSQKLAEISIADSQQEDTRLTIKQTIDALSDQELLYLEQAVKEYFDQPLAQVPKPINRQAIEDKISQIEPQLDSLWSLHATQKEIITAMESLPFHKLSNKYNLTLEQQLQTLGTIKELFTYKQQLQALIQEYETQIENHLLWEQHQETIEMKIIIEVLNLPPLQERLNNVKDELWQKEQQKQEELIVKRKSSTKPSRGIRR